MNTEPKIRASQRNNVRCGVGRADSSPSRPAAGASGPRAASPPRPGPAGCPARAPACGGPSAGRSAPRRSHRPGTGASAGSGPGWARSPGTWFGWCRGGDPSSSSGQDPSRCPRPFGQTSARAVSGRRSRSPGHTIRVGCRASHPRRPACRRAAATAPGGRVGTTPLRRPQSTDRPRPRRGAGSRDVPPAETAGRGERCPTCRNGRPGRLHRPRSPRPIPAAVPGKTGTVPPPPLGGGRWGRPGAGVPEGRLYPSLAWEKLGASIAGSVGPPGGCLQRHCGVDTPRPRAKW